MPKRPSNSSADADKRRRHWFGMLFISSNHIQTLAEIQFWSSDHLELGKRTSFTSTLRLKAKLGVFDGFQLVLTEWQPDETCRVLSEAAQERGSVLVIGGAEHLGAQAIYETYKNMSR